MTPIRRVLKNRVFRTAAVCLGLLLLSSLLLWFLRLEIATGTAQHFAKRFGAETAELTVTELGLDTAAATDVKLSAADGSLTIERVQVDFSLSDLWKANRIQNLVVENAVLTIPKVPDAPPSAPSSSDSDALNLQDLLGYIDLSPVTPLPFQRIRITNSAIVIGPESRNIPFTAHLTADTPASLSFTASASEGSLQLNARGQLSTPQKSQFAVTIESADPLQTLTRFAPDWKSALPASMHIRLGNGKLTASVSPNTPPTLNLELQSPEIEYEDLFVHLDSLEAQATASELDQVSWKAKASPAALRYDTLVFNASAPIELTGSLTDLARIQCDTQSPIGWTYDSGFASGTANASVSFDIESDGSPFSGTLFVRQLDVADFQLQSFDLPFESDLETYTLHIPTLTLEGSEIALNTPADATLVVPEDDLSPIRFDWTTAINTASLPYEAASYLSPQFDLHIHSEVGETTSETRITAKSRETETRLEIPNRFVAEGGLKLNLTVFEDEQREQYDIVASATVSNASIQSDTLTGNGIEASVNAKMNRLPISLFEAEFANPTEYGIQFAPYLNAKLEWQANQLSTADLSAQWSGGSITLSPKPDGLTLDAETMIGAIESQNLRLEQLFLNSRLDGNLRRLEGRATAEALFEGVPLKLNVSHSLEDPLDDLYFKGNYTLSPTTFVHSDLPGRVVPELAGSSFSATLEASGSFHGSSEAADASLSTTVREASFDFPPSDLHASGIELEAKLDSLRHLHSGSSASRLTVSSVRAGDLEAKNGAARFALASGETLRIDSASIDVLGGEVELAPLSVPLDGDDFEGHVSLHRMELSQIANYIEIFRGSMDGRVSGNLPFAFSDGNFILKRGDLRLPSGETAVLRYPAEGLLTEEKVPNANLSFSERLLKFLEIQPEAMAEEALGNVTVNEFHAELFPEETPDTPIRIRISGTAHAENADIPVVIDTRIHGTLSELYNFLIRLNSI